MKQYASRPWYFRAIAPLIAFLMCTNGYGQLNPDSTKSVLSDSVVTEEPSGPELFSPSIEFSTHQVSDGQVLLKATLRSKIKGSLTKLPQLKMSFVQVTSDTEKELGHALTDRNGTAQWLVKVGQLAPATEGAFTFKAKYAGNKQLEAGEEEVVLYPAALRLTPQKEEGVHSVVFQLSDLSTGSPQPVKDATVGLYVARSFKPLKIGEGTTDEEGNAIIEVPGGLPGDVKGNLLLIGQVEENERFGGVESRLTQAWGVAAAEHQQKRTRTLWTRDPPLWMLITFITLLTVVWGHYMVILVQLFRLRKEDPAHT